MSFFNLRRGDSSSKPKQASRQQPESLDVVRKRARHRLIGAAVLVLLGVLGFPLLFDTQPRPVAVDIPIDIPSRNAVKPLAVPGKPVSDATDRSAPAQTHVAASISLSPKEEIVPPAAVTPKAEVKAEAKAEVKAEPKTEPKAEARVEPKAEPKVEFKTPARVETKAEVKEDPVAPAKPAPQSRTAAVDSGERAKSLLEGQSPARSTSGDTGLRLIVQVGAFADVEKAREARARLEKAGLKTYTQVAETKDGKRIRVRVGPYATQAEADKAAAKIRALELPTAILTL